VRAILVTGAGRAFCAGADMSGLSHLAAAQGLSPERDPRHYWYPLSIGKPIVAALRGPCYGVGLQQALCCDIRFAASDVKISAPYAKRGLVGEVGITWMMARIVGPAHAMDLLLSGRAIDANEASAMGIVNRVFEPDELLPRALDYCATLAAECSPWSMRMLKQQVYHDLMLALPQAFQNSEELLNVALAGSDFAEGVEAFRLKRSLRFPPLLPELAYLDAWPEG
jgi:enoyl-CoA hydratase/carnithine racemase